MGDFESIVDMAVYPGVIYLCALTCWRYSRSIINGIRGEWLQVHTIQAAIVFAFLIGGAHVTLWGSVRLFTLADMPDVASDIRLLALALATPFRAGLGFAALLHLHAAYKAEGRADKTWWQAIGTVAACLAIYIGLTGLE